LYYVESITKTFCLKRKYYDQRPSQLEPEACNAINPGKSATGAGQPEARRAKAERTAEASSLPVMPLQKPGTFAGLLFQSVLGCNSERQQMDRFPTPLKANAPARRETRMSQEARREIADGACRDEDENAYRRSQARFAPGKSSGLSLAA
jgi:hypothetical protein